MNPAKQTSERPSTVSQKSWGEIWLAGPPPPPEKLTPAREAELKKMREDFQRRKAAGLLPKFS